MCSLQAKITLMMSVVRICEFNLKVTDLFPYPFFEWAGLKLYMGLSEVPMIGTFLIEQSQY